MEHGNTESEPRVETMGGKQWGHSRFRTRVYSLGLDPETRDYGLLTIKWYFQGNLGAAARPGFEHEFSSQRMNALADADEAEPSAGRTTIVPLTPPPLPLG